MANRLIKESSPYLLQHASNPVDWYPWGDEAFARAKAEERPLFVSIGYSACHWCHVMEQESFESEEIASLLNEHFVNVKVDREERPDIDNIYMQAVQALTGSGGWPLNIFLTPEGQPFYGGTYFPPEDRGGRPGLPRVLLAVADAYRDRREEVISKSQDLTAHIRQATLAHRSPEPLADDLLVNAYRALSAQFDNVEGGFGGEPKFPQPLIQDFLLRYHRRSGDEQALAMAEFTLEKMATSGMYDQLGGGFHRYSTDRRWMVPHFEKMLYDNALLARVYVNAFQLTRNPLYQRIAQETLDYVLRDLTSPDGGFYSAEDADSEGREGAFYVWRASEIRSALPKEEAEVVSTHFGVSDHGNFEGDNILHVSHDMTRATEGGASAIRDSASVLQHGKEKLLKLRASRPRPSRDEKIITSWNGLAIGALSEAGAAFNNSAYYQAARAAADLLLNQSQKDGRLLRVLKDDHSKLKGYLEDYAFLGHGLLSLHEATLEARWLKEARSLVDGMIELFWDGKEEVFYDTGRDHEQLILRPRDLFDHAIPCGGSVATALLLRMAIISGDSQYFHRAAASLASMREPLAKFPTSFANWLASLDFYLSTPKEIAIIGDRGNRATCELVSAAHSVYLPNRVIVGMQPGDPDVSELPIFKGRAMMNGEPTAQVCENYSCLQPVVSGELLARQLSDGTP